MSIISYSEDHTGIYNILTLFAFDFSYVSRLVESVDTSLLETHSTAVGKWLSESPSDVTGLLSSHCCELLFGALLKTTQLKYVLELCAGNSRFVHDLGPRICEPLASALKELGPVVKLIAVTETLTEDQMGRLETQVVRSSS